MGQMSKICSQALLFGQPLTSWHACNTGSACVLNRLILINMASLKVLHEVKGCIFKQGDEKPAVKWSFLTKIEVEDLASFLRNLKSSGTYYTSPSSHYTKQVGFLSFDQFPSMPKPVRNALVTRQQLDQMRTWRA